MAFSLKHAFNSLKSDGIDTTLVQPSNWNAEHDMTLAQSKILGRRTGSDGAVEEIGLAFDGSDNATFSSDVAVTGNLTVTGTLAASNFTPNASPTGTRGSFMGTAAQCPTGWVVLRGLSIGDGSSGGTERANADCQSLFTLLWANTNFVLQDSGGSTVARGADAPTDWAAHRRLVLPNYHHRFPRLVTDSSSPAATGGAVTHSHTVSGSGTSGDAFNWSGEYWSGAGSLNGTQAGSHVHFTNISGSSNSVDHTPQYIDEVAIVKL